MDTINGFAPIEPANDAAGLVTEAWYEDLLGGWGESIGGGCIDMGRGMTPPGPLY